MDMEFSGDWNMCWLKRAEDPRKPAMQALGTWVPWTSGAILKDFDDGTPRLTVDDSISVVALHTPSGDMRIHLRPDWSSSSVAYVRQVAAQDLCTVQCGFYRSEPGFLVQGGMRALIPPNNETSPGPVMEQGMVAWAGGSSGEGLAHTPPPCCSARAAANALR
ncbi:hypothetical protein CYMTET_35416 [Cymbomonas tetramitiformis]|uniref:Uncharacterized protein n=1 Tax=Cymbomonas tetramitiformis TaxID=36881 RepID=A0AAE0F970_9CHLO|nr:hypothetical protein CYMTET_35416 [Cymbomonas tetramitiformis]